MHNSGLFLEYGKDKLINRECPYTEIIYRNAVDAILLASGEIDL